MTTRTILITASLLALVAGAASAQADDAQAPKTREQVRAELLAARAAGEIRNGDTAMLEQLFATPSTRSRAEVQAEAIAARRAGLMANGERVQPLPVAGAGPSRTMFSSTLPSSSSAPCGR